MVPQEFYYAFAVLAITGLYAAWHRIRLSRSGPERVIRDRVAYMLWVAATRG